MNYIIDWQSYVLCTYTYRTTTATSCIYSTCFLPWIQCRNSLYCVHSMYVQLKFEKKKPPLPVSFSFPDGGASIVCRNTRVGIKPLPSGGKKARARRRSASKKSQPFLYYSTSITLNNFKPQRIMSLSKLAIPPGRY